MHNQYVEDLNNGSKVAYEFFKTLGNVTSYLNQNLSSINKQINLGNKDNQYKEILKSYSTIEKDDYDIIKSYDNLQNTINKNLNNENPEKDIKKTKDENEIVFEHLQKNLSNVEILLEKLKENFNLEDFEKLKEELTTISNDFNSSLDELTKKITEDFQLGNISKMEYIDLKDKIDNVCYEIKNKNSYENIDENFQNIYETLEDYKMDQNSLDYIDYRDYNEFYNAKNDLSEKTLDKENILDKDDVEREI